MAYVRNILSVKPPRRYDGEAWTTARVQESADGILSWSTIETIVLSPVDEDPAHPQSRTFTTNNALLATAYYRLQWVDGDGAISNSEVDYFTDIPPICTTDDVARLLRVDEVDEATVAKSIETATAWARKYLRDPHLGEVGTVVETFNYIGSGSTVPVTGVPTSVSVIDWPGASPRLLDNTMWTWGDSELRLRALFWTSWFRDPRFSSDEADPRTLTRVDVTTTRGATVNPLVRDGVALAAAAIWTRGPRVAKGLQGEGLGDYHYTVALRGITSEDPFFDQAIAVLRPFRRRGALVP